MYSEDRFWSKIVYLSQVGSIFCCFGWIFFGLVLGLENFPLKIPNFSIFFPSGQKNLFCLGKKVLG